MRVRVRWLGLTRCVGQGKGMTDTYLTEYFEENNCSVETVSPLLVMNE